MSKQKPKIKIICIVEGFTEENYINELKKDECFKNFNFKIYNNKSGNYSSLNKKVKSFKGIETPIFVIADLDRASSDINEVKNLEQLIKSLQSNKMNNLFLTYKNFETFLSAHFNPYETKLFARLNLKDAQALKNKKNIYASILKQGGSYEKTKKHFRAENLCFYKKDAKFPTLHKNVLNKIQSSLIFLKEYCEFLQKKYKV